ncbi:MAG: hypothetical protein LBQ03_00420 [Puniceicoccales bacterium]|jgi:hypothetical protein|nr:hypothetical protein [Puniceicoccales bacterium]
MMKLSVRRKRRYGQDITKADRMVILDWSSRVVCVVGNKLEQSGDMCMETA